MTYDHTLRATCAVMAARSPSTGTGGAKMLSFTPQSPHDVTPSALINSEQLEGGLLDQFLRDGDVARCSIWQGGAHLHWPAAAKLPGRDQQFCLWRVSP